MPPSPNQEQAPAPSEILDRAFLALRSYKKLGILPPDSKDVFQAACGIIQPPEPESIHSNESINYFARLYELSEQDSTDQLVVADQITQRLLQSQLIILTLAQGTTEVLPDEVDEAIQTLDLFGRTLPR
jgi:hypothetical protein